MEDANKISQTHIDKFCFVFEDKNLIDAGFFLFYNVPNLMRRFLVGMEKLSILNVGRNNFVVSSRILSIVTWDASAVKKSVQSAKENGLVINATCGKKTRSVIFLDNGSIVLSSIQPETLASRMTSNNIGCNCNKVIKDV